MPIIIISSEAAASAEPIAQATADALGYQRLGPEILSAIATECGVPEDKLAQALGKNHSTFKRMRSKRRSQLLAHVEAKVLDRLMADNIVCWGVGAHLYVQGVSHAMKVRLLANRGQQAEKLAAERNISIKRAEKSMQDEIRKQVQWSQSAYSLDESDPSMYDLVVNLEQIDPDEAVSTIAGAAAYRKFKPMTYSIKSLAENALAAKVKTKLLETLSDVRVQARDGKVVVTSKALKRERQKKAAAIKELAGQVEGVEFVEVHLINYVIREAAESLR
jgi:cytidylate kinase